MIRKIVGNKRDIDKLWCRYLLCGSQKIEILFSVQSKFIIRARKRKNRRKVGAKLARKLKKDKRQKNMERWRMQMKAKEMTDLIRDFAQLLEVSPLPGTFAALQEKSAN